MIAAAAAVESDDPTIARGLLQAIEPRRRGWEWQHWWNRIDESVGVLSAGEPIAGAGFDDSGSRVSLVGRSGRMTWWDAGRAEKLSTHELTAEPVQLAVFDPARRRVAAVFGAEGKAIGLWDTTTGQRLAVLEGLDAHCETLGFTPDGSRIVGASRARFAWIWDGESSEAVRVKSSDLRKNSQLRALAFVPGREKFILSARSYLSEYELASGRRLREVPTGASNIYCLDYTDDGTRIVVGDSLHKIYVGDTATSLPLALLQGHRSRVLALALSPDEDASGLGGRPHGTRLGPRGQPSGRGLHGS